MNFSRKQLEQLVVMTHEDLLFFASWLKEKFTLISRYTRISKAENYLSYIEEGMIWNCTKKTAWSSQRFYTFYFDVLCQFFDIFNVTFCSISVNVLLLTEWYHHLFLHNFQSHFPTYSSLAKHCLYVHSYQQAIGNFWPPNMHFLHYC